MWGTETKDIQNLKAFERPQERQKEINRGPVQDPTQDNHKATLHESTFVEVVKSTKPDTFEWRNLKSRTLSHRLFQLS